jgi:hypothetical protein
LLFDRSQHFVWLAVAGVGALLGLLAACDTPAQRQARENARIVRQGDKEIKRICALPEGQREPELKKVKEESGMVLYCGNGRNK